MLASAFRLPNVKFVFPTAPTRRVTINMGASMPGEILPNMESAHKKISSGPWHLLGHTLNTHRFAYVLLASIRQQLPLKATTATPYDNYTCS